MCVVRLDHDGAPGGQGRRGVATGDREREWEVARPEHRDGAERHAALPDVGPWQRFPVGKGRVDAGLVPAALAQHTGEQSQLARGAPHLTGQPGDRQAALGVGALDEHITARVEVVRDGLEEAGALFDRGIAVGAERIGRGRARGLDVRGVAVGVRGFEERSGLRIDAADLPSRAAHRRTRDQHLPGQVCCLHHGCHSGTVRPAINACPS